MPDLKKLMGWLLGSGQQKPEAHVENTEHRRFLRLQLANCAATMAQGATFPVSNLSYGGFRADLTGWAGLNNMQIGTSYNCQLEMQNVQLACRITVKNLFGTMVGFAFDDFSPVQSRVISDFIKPRIIGYSLREINAAKLKNDSPDLKMRWFQGDDGVQVFLWHSVEGKNVRQEFYFLDYFISWDKTGEGLRTGKVKAGERGSFGRAAPDSIAFFRKTPYRALKLGRTIIEHSKLPDEARTEILREIAAEESRLFHCYIIKEAGVIFVASQPAGHELEVLNVSISSMTLYNPPETAISFEIPLKGHLRIGDNNVAAVFQPAHLQTRIISGQLSISDPESARHLEKFLAPRLLAQYIEEVPAPPELPPFAPPNARCYLYTGLHNTHMLSLIETGGKLHHGRIAFMDRALSFRNNLLSEYRCQEGLIFPCDWELEASTAQQLDSLEPMTLQICREMIENAEQIAPEVKQAWLASLPVLK